MTTDNELLKERVTAILLWGIPWGIVVAVFAFFYDEFHISSFMGNGAIGLLLFVAFCYIVSSAYSFVGFVLPLFSAPDDNEFYHLIRPSSEGKYSDSAQRLMGLFKNDKRTERLYASCIVIHDFLVDYKERKTVKDISLYIPSVMQMREYPYDSLCMMLSSQEKLKAIDTDKYYNFELILKTCLSDGK